MCKGGRSGTMIYSYPFSVCRRAVVVTFDLSASNLDLLRRDHWLADPRNVLQLHLSAPAWLSQEPTAATPTTSPKEQMAAWTVDAVAEFLTSHDLRGPAGTLQHAGVNGADLLAWTTVAEVEADVKVVPLTARKILACRDELLATT